ncbi:unnamed protein product [Heterosigma akashiwo]|uniref:60S acidic ribosomal protein P1 n=1 Tax=Heterosigma akashiwo TaxID=2829 RepID=A0A6V1KRU0_HETAK|mmetsp:Transcript_44932/g.70322  ORF Transcript_44932/g.70322 Transcript_44932/m.70322 type:complete len:118 (-) Transcript_44932:16-369(-)
MSLAELSGAAKEELVVSLASLVVADSDADLSAENLEAVIKASGNSVASYWTSLFASFLEKSEGVEKFCAGPGAGGGGGGAAPAAGGAAAPAAEEKKEEEEEEEADVGAGDMFGGSDY